MTETENTISFLKHPQLRRRTLVAVGGFLFVCLAIWGLYGAEPIMPHPERYKVGAGVDYAEKLADGAQRLSLVLLVAGWIFVLIGGFLAMSAALVGQAKQNQEHDTILAALRAQRGLLCSAFAIIFAAVGWQCLDRSSAASRVASVATRAIASECEGGDPDKKAYEVCVAAKASWLEGRMSHDRLESFTDELKRKGPTSRPGGRP